MAPSSSHDSNTVQFSTEKIHKVIKRLKPKMTRDPEGYSPFLVKQLVSTFADPLALLFSSFLSIGRPKIPSAWKRAIITPIFKKGASSNPANYRPVSVTSVFGKVMERVVAADMLDYLLSNKLLNSNQHGFLSKRSTLTIRYDTRCYFNVRSKADISQLNLPFRID